MRLTPRRRALAIFALTLCGAFAPLSTANLATGAVRPPTRFIPIDSPSVSAISGDGKVVVGDFFQSGVGDVGFRWSEATGMSLLPTSPDVAILEIANVNVDGSVVVGQGRFAPLPGFFFTRRQALRWSEATGYQALGVLTSDPSIDDSYAYAVSADGSVVAGQSDSNDGDLLSRQGFRWTAGSGMVGNGFASDYAVGISANGQIIVGTTNTIRPYRWTSATGVQVLSNLLPDFSYGGPADISADGEVIVGYYQAPTHRDAWVWTAATGMQQLPISGLPETTTVADAVSQDGSTIVGNEVVYDGTQFIPRAVVWRKQHGAYQFARLSDLLMADGVDITGWQLRGLADVSDDGTRMVGIGYNPLGQEQAFLVEWHVPEPPGALMAVVACLALRRLRQLTCR